MEPVSKVTGTYTLYTATGFDFFQQPESALSLPVTLHDFGAMGGSGVLSGTLVVLADGTYQRSDTLVSWRYERTGPGQSGIKITTTRIRADTGTYTVAASSMTFVSRTFPYTETALLADETIAKPEHHFGSSRESWCGFHNGVGTHHLSYRRQAHMNATTT